MPITIDNFEVAPIPQVEASGGGNRIPPIRTAIGFGGSDEQFKGADKYLRSEFPQKYEFDERLAGGGCSGLDRVIAESIITRPGMSVMEYLVSTPPIQKLLPYLAAGYGLAEITHNLLNISPVW